MCACVRASKCIFVTQLLRSVLINLQEGARRRTRRRVVHVVTLLFFELLPRSACVCVCVCVCARACVGCRASIYDAIAR